MSLEDVVHMAKKMEKTKPLSIQSVFPSPLLTPRAHTNRHNPCRYRRRACIWHSGQPAAPARRRNLNKYDLIHIL